MCFSYSANGLSSLLRGDKRECEETDTCDKHCNRKSVVGGVGVGCNVVGIGATANGTSAVYVVVIRKVAVLFATVITNCLVLAVCLAAVVNTSVVTGGAYAVNVGVICLGRIGSVAAGTVEGVSVLILSPSAVCILVVVSVKVAVLLSALGAGCLSLTGSGATGVVAACATLVANVIVTVVMSLGSSYGCAAAGVGNLVVAVAEVGVGKFA